MEILKKYDTGFTQIANTILCDNSISLRAKGVYAYLFSKPDGWQFHIDVMEKELKETRGQIYSAIKELINAGFVKRYQINENGRFGGCIYEFIDKTKQPQAEILQPCLENPHTNIPCTGKPVCGSTPTHNNINNINNNNININNNNNIFMSKTEIFDEIIKYWNIVAERWNLAKICVMTDKRLKSFKLRYKESGCKSVKEFFQLIDEAIMGSLFLQGKKQVKDRNGEWDIVTTDWISCFDFFLQAKSCMKALEGGYDDPDVRKQKSCGQWERFKQMYEERKPVHFD